jgi:hypothetical protein
VKWLHYPWLHRVLGVALGAVFLYAAHAKILDPQPLVTIIWNYRVLPAGPINLMELRVGMGLVTGFKRRAAALCSIGLLVAFIVALGINAVRGVNVACGCFSTSAEDVNNAWLLVLRDLPMLLAALVMLLFPPTHRPGVATQPPNQA